jgi:FtsZ-binding cell division protein ZapB
MWLSKDLVGFFQISHDTVSSLRSEVAALKAENGSLRHENATLKTHFDWLRTKVNALELERAGLLEKAYNIKLPVPEIARQTHQVEPDAFSFEDLGDALAKKYGLPTFEHQPDPTA